MNSKVKCFILLVSLCLLTLLFAGCVSKSRYEALKAQYDDYEVLKAQCNDYETLRAQYNVILAEHERLTKEATRLEDENFRLKRNLEQTEQMPQEETEYDVLNPVDPNATVHYVTHYVYIPKSSEYPKSRVVLFNSKYNSISIIEATTYEELSFYEPIGLAKSDWLQRLGVEE